MTVLAILAKSVLFILCTLLLLVLIEFTRPLTHLLLKLATPKLIALKEKAQDKPSPFELTDKSLWIAESENAYALKDIRPRAPHHYLVISKARINTLPEANPELVAEMMNLCCTVAQQAGIQDKGFRVVINTNPESMQTVYHLHMHVLGGKQLGITAG